MVSLAGCGGEGKTSKSFTYSVDTGDSITISLDTSDNYDLSSDLPFEVSKDGNEYVFWSYSDSEYNYVILIEDSVTDVVIGDMQSEESAKECFDRLTISHDPFHFPRGVKLISLEHLGLQIKTTTMD